MTPTRFLLLACLALAANGQLLIHLRKGDINGAYEHDPQGQPIRAWRGVPYAEPPVGNLLFQPAVPKVRWSGVRSTTADAPVCIQNDNTYMIPATQQSRDCLYLGVFAPAAPNPGEIFPVLVFLPGGSNINEADYANVTNFVNQNRVLLVVPRYRVGPWGYLALKSLQRFDSRGTSGNYGITDCQEALRWVQQNAAAFGADPHRVTVMGQSSGGTNIYAMLASPASQGLFQRAWTLSASPNLHLSLRATQRMHEERFLVYTRCGSIVDLTQQYHCLHSLSDQEMLDAVAANNADPTGQAPWTGFPLWPNGPGNNQTTLVMVDGGTVTESVQHALATPLVDVALVIQDLRYEDDLVPDYPIDFSYLASPEQVGAVLDSGAYGNVVGSWIVPLYQTADTYPGPSYDATTVLAMTTAMGTDICFTCGNIELARIADRAFESPVYMNVIAQGPANPFPDAADGLPATLAFHSWDYVVLANLSGFTFPAFQPSPFVPYEYAPADVALGRLLMSAVRAFVTSPADDVATSMSALGFGRVSTGVARGDYRVNVVDQSASRGVTNYREFQCDGLRAHGVGRPYDIVN